MDDADKVLARWQQRQEEVEAMLASGAARVGVVQPAQAIGKSGLELFASMLSGELPFAPMAQTLDFFLVEVEKGRAVFQGRPGPRFFNPMGTVHGGWYATLLDSAVGCAVHSCMPAGKSYTTVELKLNIVKALSAKVGLIRAEGNVIHLGGQIATADGTLYGPDGKLYAHASTTCLVFDFPPAKTIL